MHSLALFAAHFGHLVQAFAHAVATTMSTLGSSGG